MIDTFSKNVVSTFGAFAAVAAFATAFQTLITLSLSLQLIITAVFGLISLYTAVIIISKGLYRKGEIGFKITKKLSSQSSVWWYGIKLFIVCLVFVLLALIEVVRVPLRIIYANLPLHTELTLLAPVSKIDRVLIQIPNQKDADCTWKSIAATSSPSLHASIVDWDKPDRQILLTNFQAPQSLAIQCDSISVKAIAIETIPPSVTILSNAQLSFYRISIIIAGGVLWLIATLGLGFWSRQARFLGR